MAAKKTSLRQQLRDEAQEEFRESRVGQPERYRAHWFERWNQQVVEHETWLGHLDAVGADLRARRSAIEQLVAGRKIEGEILELDGDRRSVGQWRLAKLDLDNALLDVEEGWSPMIRSRETIDGLLARGVRPRAGCLTVFQDRFGARRTRLLLAEACTERAKYQ